MRAKSPLTGTIKESNAGETIAAALGHAEWGSKSIAGKDLKVAVK